MRIEEEVGSSITSLQRISAPMIHMNKIPHVFKVQEFIETILYILGWKQIQNIGSQAWWLIIPQPGNNVGAQFQWLHLRFQRSRTKWNLCVKQEAKFINSRLRLTNSRKYISHDCTFEFVVQSVLDGQFEGILYMRQVMRKGTKSQFQVTEIIAEMWRSLQKLELGFGRSDLVC